MPIDLLEKFFIPQKIKVGFCERKDTYTGLLAYLTYYDEKGALRKKTSWENWRDHRIESKEFDNVPTEGFIINKSRASFSGYSTNHYFRIYDPRGFEFEITATNFIQIINSCNIIDKTFQGKLVYSWVGTELQLLPCNTEEYKKSKDLSDKLFEKVLTVDDLVPGTLYRVENTDNNWCYYKDITKEFVYIGKVKLAKNLGKGYETKLLFYYISSTEKHRDIVVPVQIKNVKYSIAENYLSNDQVNDILSRFNNTAWSFEFWNTPGIVIEFNLPEERIKEVLEKDNVDLFRAVELKLNSETKNLGYLDTTGNIVKVLRRKVGVVSSFRPSLQFKNTYNYATFDISDVCSPIKVNIINDLGKCKWSVSDYWGYTSAIKFTDIYPDSKITAEPEESTQPEGTAEIPLVYTTRDGYISSSLHYMISTDCMYDPTKVFKYFRLPNKI